jgi:hypothetical protein
MQRAASPDVRFALKATFTNQDVIRRFVPIAAVSNRSKAVPYSITPAVLRRIWAFAIFLGQQYV